MLYKLFGYQTREHFVWLQKGYTPEQRKSFLKDLNPKQRNEVKKLLEKSVKQMKYENPRYSIENLMKVKLDRLIEYNLQQDEENSLIKDSFKLLGLK